MVVVALLALPCSYIGAYYRLSRASLRNNGDYGLESILYVPIHEAFPASGDHRSLVRQRAIRRHYALAIFFAPVNWIDRLVFGTPPPESCFMMLSG